MAATFAQTSVATLVDVPENPSYQSFRQSRKGFVRARKHSAYPLSGQGLFRRLGTRDSSGSFAICVGSQCYLLVPRMLLGTIVGTQ